MPMPPIRRPLLHGMMASMLSVPVLAAAYGSLIVLLTDETWRDLLAGLFVYTVVGVPCALLGALLYGLPIYLLLQRLQVRTLPWLLVCGALAGFLVQLVCLGVDWSISGGILLLLFCGHGMGAAAAFWYGAERWGTTGP